MDELSRLSNSNLQRSSEAVIRPNYDRSRLTPGIVHIGVGNFHRAHQAWYLHRLMQMGQAHDWAIVGAGVREADAEMREKLLEQDCLTTLIELAPSTNSAEIIGSMIDFLPIVEGNGPLIEQIANPATRIVSLTVTEGGYYIDPATSGFHSHHPDILHDAANPEAPKTAFGAIVAGLRRRRDAGCGPLTGLSCDNLSGNGAILRQTVVSLAKMSDPNLADWIDANCTFPNSMVDCIVPATGQKEIALAREFGIEDAAPVTHENFRQWVIEDDFCAGRPNWDRVGATFSSDVHAYESLKIRLLNAGHQLIGDAGEILAIETIAGCMQHPLIRSFFRAVEINEIAEQVRSVPSMTAYDYVDLVDRRFSNTAIVDQTRRIAFNGSSKHPGFLHPTLRERLAAGRPVEGLALSEALWARMCHGTREDGSAIEPNDPVWHSLIVAAAEAKERPRAWLEQQHFYRDLNDEPQFTAAFERWLGMIWSEGCEAALRRYTESALSLSKVM